MTVMLSAAGGTHVGLMRRRNEDGLHVGRSLFAVADGLGGHIAGDVASRIVIDVVRSHDQPGSEPELAATLARTVGAANDALGRRIKDEPKLAGMGSTLVAMLWAGTSMALANVGDSRAYLLRARSSVTAVLRPLTEDHTYGHLVAGAYRVPDLPDRMSRWLDGRADGRSPDLSVHKIRPGDWFLLCSDGLTSCVSESEIYAALNLPGAPQDTVNRLIAAALDAGGPDNVTVIVIDIAHHAAETVESHPLS